MSGVEEGVYFFKNAFSTLILELRDGHYRYWFSSDVSIGDEPAYPLVGRYSVSGAVVELEHKHPVVQGQWTFTKLNGETTLWRPAAIKDWSATHTLDPYGVLHATKLKPEEIWRKRS
jgi:hypothetical protein